MSITEALSPTEIALVADLIGAVGTCEFYDRLLQLVDERIHCPRRMIMKYSRFARPDIIFNTSIESQLIDTYNAGLYRLDPLLRRVTNENVGPVIAFSEVRKDEPENSFYDEIFKAGVILDELAVMLPTIGGSFVALCFDRPDRKFASHETAWALLLHPILVRAHDLHVRTAMFSNLSSVSAGGRVGIIALADDGKVVHRNESWRREVAAAEEPKLIAAILGRPAGTPVEIRNRVAHWELFDQRDAPTAVSYRTVFLEEPSEGYIDRDIKSVLEGFFTAQHLSARESQIVEKIIRGFSTGTIARTLGLSIGTVKNYKRRLYSKLAISNERELFPLFVEHLLGRR